MVKDAICRRRIVLNSGFADRVLNVDEIHKVLTLRLE